MIDLHIHSRCSDGSASVREIVAQYREMGFSHIAITDHDVICTDPLPEPSEAGGLRVITGIELSLKDPASGRKVHLLGYFFDPAHPGLNILIERIAASRKKAAAHIMAGLRQMGYPVEEEGVKPYSGSGGIYKQHILHYLLDQGLVRKMFGGLDRKLFGRGGPLYYPIDYADFREGLATLRDAGALSVLAHPGQGQLFDLVEEMKELGLEGIEVTHPTHSQADREKSARLAGRLDLLQIPGSDNHGIYTQTRIHFERLTLEEQAEERLLGKLEEKLA